ncbi:MAG: hypothetical protein AAF674_15705 [Pseudomonadota bacterium]
MSSQTEIIDQLAIECARIAPLGLPQMLREQNEAVARIRAAGECLHEIYGVSSLHDAIADVHDLTDGEFATRADFNHLWDGIGCWAA